jgi:hypothetical protein
MTRDGFWAVCRKSKDEKRGEDNLAHWGWLVAQDIVKAYGKVLTGRDDSLVSSAGHVHMSLLVVLVMPFVQVLLFAKLLQ